MSDVFTSGFYCLGPGGDKFVVGNETLREQAYLPRGTRVPAGEAAAVAANDDFGRDEV